MKLRQMFSIIAVMALVSIGNAARIDWGLDVSDATFKSTWTGATVYSYFVSGSATTAIETFIKGWSSTYEPSASVAQGGKNEAWGGSYKVWGVTTSSEDTAGYLVTILYKDNENAIYSYADTWVYVGNQAVLDEANAVSYFTEDGYDTTSPAKGNGGAWTAFTVAVPEPTALALLALGIAGLALKRKVA